MLAVAEFFKRLATLFRPTEATLKTAPDGIGETGLSIAEYWSCRFVMLRSAVIGTILGAIPSIGSTDAAFMSYASAKKGADGGIPFGSGSIKGIAATESANRAVMGANLIPLLGTGILGSISAALLISAFKIHGIQPGPLLFETQGRLIYGLFGAMLMANLCNLFVGHISMRLWIFVVRAPASFILPSALLFCFVGAYVSTGGMFSVSIMLISAVVS